MQKHLKIALIALLLPLTAHAKPVAYKVDNSKSDIAFLYNFDGNETIGSFPTFIADVTLDFERLENSKINVTINTHTAKGGFVFATQALRGPKMLDTATHPVITFQSTRLSRTSEGAQLTGNITVKNVTRPITLNARIFRTTETTIDDQDNLLVKLTGQIDRSEFGVDGYRSLVGDVLKIAITTRITKN